MCDTCGCNSPSTHYHITNQEPFNCKPSKIKVGGHTRVIRIEKEILEKNSSIAEDVRQYLTSKLALAINIMSSPGAGKTTLLEKSAEYLKRSTPLAAIEGDQCTTNDADRLSRLGIPTVQINTNNGCHLEASMIKDALCQLHLKDKSILFIENIGNLVCPGLFDIGQHIKVVLVSTTEGDDKPLKYAHMFQNADICIINKIDLLPYLPSDISVLRANVQKVNPEIQIFETSAYTGAGVKEWCQYLLNEKMIRNIEIDH